MRKHLFILFAFCIYNSYSQWVQVGSDISGVEDGDWCGAASLSFDGQTMAVGIPGHNGIGGYNTGGIKIYAYTGGDWEQLGETIEGEEYNFLGWDCHLSGDGNRVIISSDLYSATEIGGRHYLIFEYINSNWVQLGEQLLEQEGAFSASADINSNGNIVAVGTAQQLSDTGNVFNLFEGSVKVYTLSDDSNWNQLGNTVFGDSIGYEFGRYVALSDDGSTFVSSARRVVVNGIVDAGHVRAYGLVDSNWVQLGQDIFGEETNEYYTSSSLDINADGSVLAIGSGDFENSKGRVRIFEYIDSIWVQVGSDIIGEEEDEFLGIDVKLSKSGDTIVVGMSIDASYIEYGNMEQARIYTFNGSSWEQIGNTIIGENEFSDWSGRSRSVDISADGSMVAVSSRSNDYSTDNTGNVKVFNYLEQNVSLNDLGSESFIYPNPANSIVYIDQSSKQPISEVKIVNTSGQVILEKHLGLQDTYAININDLSNGIYMIHVLYDDHASTVQKIVKRNM